MARGWITLLVVAEIFLSATVRNTIFIILDIVLTLLIVSLIVMRIKKRTKK